MKKRGLLLFAAAVLCILAGLAAYHCSFPLDADLNGLEPAALQWFNRGRSVFYEADQLQLYQPVTVGDRTYVPLELDGQLGHLRLSRGLTGGIISISPNTVPALSATEWWSLTGSGCYSSRGGTATTASPEPSFHRRAAGHTRWTFRPLPSFW